MNPSVLSPARAGFKPSEPIVPKAPKWGSALEYNLLSARKVYRTIPYLLTPPLGQDMTQGQFLRGV